MQGTKLLFTIFRIQLHKSIQIPLLDSKSSESEIIRIALEERPSDEVRGYHWRIGNVRRIADDAMTFFIGKELSRTFGIVDEDGDFHDTQALIAPNTLAIVDLKYQLLAIAHKPELSQNVLSIASRIRTLLRSTEVIASSQRLVTIQPIHDPTDFIQALVEASAVVKFRVSYGLPNVWDVERDFQRPIQETTRAVGASESEATFKGDDLNRPPLVKLARASSAIGKGAIAWLKKTPSSKVVPVRQSVNHMVLEEEITTAEHESLVTEDLQSQPMRLGDLLIRRMREIYQSIRNYE